MIFDIFLALAALCVTICVIAYAWRRDDRTGDWTWANLKARLSRLVPKR